MTNEPTPGTSIPFMDNSLSHRTLHVTGMDCATCARSLEGAVSRLAGVDEARVNFTSATLVVAGSASIGSITRRIETMGYGVATPEEALLSAHAADTRTSGVIGFVIYLTQTRKRLVVLMGALVLLATALAESLRIPIVPAGAVAGVYVLAMCAAGYPIAKRGLQSLFLTRQITIGLLMTIATVGAVVIGEIGEAATVILLFAIGEALEGYTADRARDSLRSLLSLAPQKATVQRACMDCEEHLGLNGYEGGPCPLCGMHEISVSIASVEPGDVVIIKPGGRLPVDGIILSGASHVNQAPITGESTPVARSPGDEVFAGTVNGEGALELETLRPPQDSTISRIIRLVEQAQAQRSPAERFVDRFARWYTPAVVLIALLTAGAPPLLFQAPFFDTPEGMHGWLYRAITLLIVACPCALVISTPVTVVSTLTALARRGILVKGGEFLDALARIRAIALDKTGTLTVGEPTVVAARTAQCDANLTDCVCASCDEMVAVAAAVESHSEHPLARAIVAEAETRHVKNRYSPAKEVLSLAGRGVQGKLGESVITVGSHTLLHQPGSACEAWHLDIEHSEANGRTIMLVGKDEALLGYVSIADTPRPTSKQALSELRVLDPSLRTVMLTGDSPLVAEIIARQIGSIDTVISGLLPAEKVGAVRDLQAQYGVVAMVGDGVNDAPALASANVGIAMGGGGTAQAMETADIVLMQDNLTHLPEAIRSSRRARAIIRQNIAVSLGLKALFLLLAVSGTATLWMAVLADMGASLLVTLNGMRMLQDSPRRGGLQESPWRFET